MNSIFIASLSFGLLAAGSSPPLEHRVQIDHKGAAINVNYRGEIDVIHKQRGSAAPGGRPSSLRCEWKAKVIVNREAQHASGALMSRTFESEDSVKGSRPGWCVANRKAIAQDVALKTDSIQQNLLAAAAADRMVLTAEVEHAMGSVPTG